MIRKDRPNDALRTWTFETGFTPYAEGSVLVSSGNTKVLCNASVEHRQPRWLDNPNQGWITAEYAMLPRSTHERNRRPKNGPNGRATEIQRLIGRSLRSAVNLEALGPVTITLDCDVLQADAGTRCASISGSWVALVLALDYLMQQGSLKSVPLKSQLAAVGLGIIDNQILTDLCYEEDSQADVDLNLVMNHKKEVIEIQGTAEGTPFRLEQLDQIIDLGWRSLQEIFELQQQAILQTVKTDALTQYIQGVTHSCSSTL